MSGDFPDDWFRPEAQASGAGSGPDARRHRADADDSAARHRAQQADVDTEPGRWTDQFKPVDRPAHRVPLPPRHGGTSPSSPDPARTSPGASPAPGPAAAPAPGSTPPGSHSVGVNPSEGADVLDVPRRPRSRGRGVLATTAGLAVMLGLGIAVGQLWSQRQQGDEAGLRITPTPTARSAHATLVPWTGAVEQVRATGVQASCTAPTQTGADGSPVPSDADRVLDGELSTGWRCDGSGVSQTLSFSFPPGTTVVGVRMTNGYTKTVRGTDLYPQYRRLSRVTWSFPQLDNAYFLHNLADEDEGLQEIRIPPTSADGGMQLQVTAATDPGDSGATRDAIVVTEVEFLTRKG